MLEVIQFGVAALGLVACTTAAVLAVQFCRSTSRSAFRRAIVFELSAKSIATFSTLIFSLSSLHNMLGGEAGWNAIDVITAIVLRVLIFAPALASSVYLMHVLHCEQQCAAALSKRIADTLAERPRNVEPDI